MVHSVGSSPLLILWILIITSTVKNALSHPIVNGAPPRDSHQFRFAVSLQRMLANGTLMHFCGGTYLGAGWILTANHCTVGSIKDTEMYALLGGLPLSTGNKSTLYRVRQVFSHPDYNAVTLGGDIALLRLSSATDQKDSYSLPLLDKMVSNTLLLPSPSNNPSNSNSFGMLNNEVGEAAIGEECHIFGYGSASFYGAVSDRLQYGPVRPLSFDRCVQMLGPVVAPVAPNSGMFCAIGITDSCRGDSGSGLVCRRRIRRSFRDNGEVRPYTLRGIISYGAGCGAPASPGVYTDVGFYRRWLDERISSSLLLQMPNVF
ncbi:chymotrypsin A-like [Ochlerotatus camptorhynchus]|uniref:chymotrypsin A-like n=1 Tax=Ochlerotatus camptorhynchus TaxID=644619 RepID=UPI0031E129DD